MWVSVCGCGKVAGLFVVSLFQSLVKRLATQTPSHLTGVLWEPLDSVSLSVSRLDWAHQFQFVRIRICSSFSMCVCVSVCDAETCLHKSSRQAGLWHASQLVWITCKFIICDDIVSCSASFSTAWTCLAYSSKFPAGMSALTCWDRDGSDCEQVWTSCLPRNAPNERCMKEG